MLLEKLRIQTLRQGWGVAWLFLVAAGMLGAAPPNILIVLTDDQGFGDVGINGNPYLDTPHMDRLAREGARLNHFFVEPVCAPTRAALLTGRNPTRTGVHGVTRNREIMRTDEVTLAELLRDQAGYATGAFGKWHNGSHWPQHPNAQGFDTFFGFCGGVVGDYYDPGLERNGEPVAKQGYIADVLADEAIAFMREQAQQNRPFLCYVPFNTPHTPVSAPHAEWQRWRNRSEPADAYTRAVYAMCENLDMNLGRLLAVLDELDLARDTIVVFLGDNGPKGERFNGGMLGTKASVMEGGVRVPCFIRWPARIAPGTVVEENAAHIDLLPTLSAAAGIDDPAAFTQPLDGIDLSARLESRPGFAMPQRYHYTWFDRRRWSIRSDRYRATASTLHDMIDDPGQTENLLESAPEQHATLIQAFRDWAQTAVPAELTPLPVEVGYDAAPRVAIEAHEFELSPGEGQGIAYCEQFGYAGQWIEAWSDVAASAYCPLRVVASGHYRATIRYACPPEAIGSRFVLQAGASQLAFTIDQSGGSAAHPAAEQAGLRQGGYLSRDVWMEADAGVIDLAEGDVRLELRALTMPGEAMPEIKTVTLTKIEP